ncbi:MAG: bifunctional oligoribonuclease/PAP phosphatase NrnA [Lachnospiraceae bacterium]|nr:bifunctional oligoribonuclease/PAP phosphatase NrnA [Lachnospiraceae bacterium]
MAAILDVCKGKKRIGIAGHVRPDGDSIGSALSIYNYLKDNTDSEVHVFLQTIPTIFSFLKNSDKIEEPGSFQEPFDLFIAVDCGDIDRLGPAGKYFKEAKETFCIDHHLSNDAFADISDVEPEKSSACEMVYDRMNPDFITKEIAECLYCGLITDTGVFQYSSTSSHTMHVAGVLMDKGIDYPYIVDHVFYEKTFDQNRILGYALCKAELHLDGKVIYCHITRHEMKEYNVEPKHLEGIVASLRSTRGVEVAIFAYDTIDNQMKVSLRATNDINVAEIAQRYRGGGHAKAAGLLYGHNEAKFKEEILGDIKEALS